MESHHSAATGPTKQPSLPLNRPTADASASRPKFGRVVISLENPILPEDTITNTPSLIDGLDRETENDLRITGCKLIQISGILLRLPQVAMATGQVLFQRYYYSKSFVRFPMEVTAMACVVLASKVEEAPRRIRDIINVFHNMKQVRLNQPTVPMLLNEAYVTLKNNVIKAERRILKELGFCVHVKHPHKYIITVAEILGNSKNTELIQSAWSYMNDSLQTNAFVRFPPETIACACIHLSSRVLRVPLPTSPPWYFVFGVDTETIKQVCITILQLYTRNPLPQEELEAKVDIARKAVDEVKLKARQELLRGEARRLDEEDLSTTPTFSQSQTAAYNKHGDGKAADEAKLNARQELHQGEARRLDEEDQDQTAAYKHGDGEKMDGRRVLVDVERGRTVKGWLPSRLGGGLSDSKSRVQVREEREEKSFGSRDRFDSRRGGAGDREDRDRDRSDRRRRSKSRERERDRRSRDRTSDRDRHKDRYYERGGGFDNDYEQKPSSRGGFYDYDGGMSRKHRSRSKDRSEKKRYARSRSKSPSQDRKRSRYYKNGDGRAAKHGRHHLYIDSGEMEEGEDRSYDREYTRRFHSGQVAIRGEDDYEDSFTNRLCRD